MFPFIDIPTDRTELYLLCCEVAQKPFTVCTSFFLDELVRNLRTPDTSFVAIQVKCGFVTATDRPSCHVGLSQLFLKLAGQLVLASGCNVPSN
jgi:hypothetical protein